MPARSQYSFLGALRIFSLAVAVISCGLGIRLGWNSADPQILLALLLLLGGVLAQAGINLVNDSEDLHQYRARPVSGTTRGKILFNQKAGWLTFVLAALIGLYLVSIRGWPLFLTLVMSGLLALSYHAGPFNFKRNGMAFVQVFLLMGIIMIQASYFTMTGQVSLRVLWLSLPVSLLISLLLLSNEIRDYDTDLRDQTRTLSVRIGLPAARWIYWALITAALTLTLSYSGLGWLDANRLPSLLPALTFLPLLYRHLYADDRSRLTPLSGRFFLVFGLAYLYLAPPI